VPRAVLARPVRWRAREHLAAIGTGGQQRMVAQGAGGAVGGALLCVAVHLAHRGVQVHGDWPIAWAGPGRPRAREQLLAQPVELAHVPEVNERRNVPRVEGAITRWPSTWLVAPQRKRSASSIQSPPASIACTRVNSFRPGWAAPGRSPRSISASAACSSPSRWASVAGSSSPALAMAWVSSKRMLSWSGVWEDAN